MIYSLSMTYTITSLKELSDWSAAFLEDIKQDNDHATIIALSGDLGAGKTTFTQYVAQNLGVSETITSPTFVIQKEYNINQHDWIEKLIHIDAYRLESKSELEYLGWHELIADRNNLIVIEWPEMVDGIDMPNVVKIEITIHDNHTRTLRQK